MPDKVVDLDFLAGSAYRAFVWSKTREEPEPWEKLSLEIMSFWLQLVRRAPAIMDSLEGRTYQKVGEELCKAGHLGKDDLARVDLEAKGGMLGFECVARHLMCLLDADDVDDIPALERSWRWWATLVTEKRSKNVKPA